MFFLIVRVVLVISDEKIEKKSFLFFKFYLV